jgi:hypothetical protein
LLRQGCYNLFKLNRRDNRPSDVGGEELALLPGRYGYQITRQTSSHLRLTATQASERLVDRASEGVFKRHQPAAGSGVRSFGDVPDLAGMPPTGAAGV